MDALRLVLEHPQLDAAFKELVLTLPSESYIAEQLDSVDPQRIHSVREAMRLATGPGPATAVGKPPTKPTPTPALTSPNPSPQAAARWPDLALNMLCLARPGRRRVGPAKPTSGSKTRAT